MEEDDKRYRYLSRQVIQAFKHISNEKFREFWLNDITRRKLTTFFDDEDVGSLFIRETSKNTLEIVDRVSKLSKSSIFYIIKMKNIQITSENITQEILFGDMSTDPISHLSSITQQIYVPLIKSAAKNQEWNESITNDISNTFETFISQLQIAEGHMRGTTCLPLPKLSNHLISDITMEMNGSNHMNANSNLNASSNSKVNSVSRIHELENIIISWAKQIKNVLKRDSEDIFLHKGSPGPLVEVEFWRSKSNNLNGIFQQLQNPIVRRIINLLDLYKSTYNEPFIKLCKEVTYARVEANDVLKYLLPLSNYLIKLENETIFESILQQVYPIFQILYTISKSSNYYNITSKITVMLRLLGNVMIRQTAQYLNLENISITFIEMQADAIKNLSTAIRILTKYKEIFTSYQEKSKEISSFSSIVATTATTTSTIRSNSTRLVSWKNISSSIIFYKVDQFLERCYDLLDLSHTISQFTKLIRVEIGGTKGKLMTTSVNQIYNDFEKSLENIKNISSIILDADNKEFDNIYFEFSNQMKELDRRVASVIINAFDDAVAISGKIRLLETFDDLIQRPIIYAAIEKKHTVLIELIKVDIIDAEKIFMNYCDNPPVPHNLPPISGAITWSRGLLERIQGPIEKLERLDVKLLDREDTKEVFKLYTTFIKRLHNFDQEKIEFWCKSIEDTSQVKLKNPLLRRWNSDANSSNSNTTMMNAMINLPTSPLTSPGNIKSFPSVKFMLPSSNNIPSLLCVNFDPLLIRLLREIKYFLLLGIQVPQAAVEIYQQMEVFRRYTGNLELIVNMYNDIQTTLLPVERPLIRSQLDHIDKTLSQGIASTNATTSALDGRISRSVSRDQLNMTTSNAVSYIHVSNNSNNNNSNNNNNNNSNSNSNNNNSKTLNWKSSTIDNFISEAMNEVRESTDFVQALKSCLRRIEQIVESWLTPPNIERGNKALSIDEFYVFQQKCRHAKSAQIKESGQEIHRLIKDINKKLKISQVTSDWKAYIDFVNNFVIEGLSNAVISSIVSIEYQLNPKRIELESRIPLLEIQLDLIHDHIKFVPDFGFLKGHRDIGSIETSELNSPKNTMLELTYLHQGGSGGGGTDSNLSSPAGSPKAGMKLISIMNHNTKYGGVKDVFQTVVNGIIGVANAFKRIDTSEGSYLQDISEGPNLRIHKSKVFHYLDITERKCIILQAQFRNYEFLWTEDMNKTFKEFLSQAVVEEKVPFIVQTSSTNLSGESMTAYGSPTSSYTTSLISGMKTSMFMNSNGFNSKAIMNFNITTQSPRTTMQTLNQLSESISTLAESGYWIKTNINLDLFGEKISHYTELLSEISDMKAIYEIDFLKVNGQPLKQAIFTYATKWLYMYTQYLQDYIINRLNSIHDLIRDINKGLDQSIETNDREAMMSVMTYIRDVRKHIPEMSTLFDPLRSIVFLLKVKNIQLDLPQIGGYAALDFLEQAAMQWDNTVNKSYRVKESIQPLQNVMIEGIKKEIKVFDQNAIKLGKDFLQNGPFNWLDLINIREAYQLLDKYYTQLSILQENGKSLNELQDLFELPISTHQHLKEIENIIICLKSVWDMICMVESLFLTWKITLWPDIQTDDFMEEIKKMIQKLQYLPSQAKEWNLCKRLEQNIQIMMKVLPLVNDLHSPAIRERHWKQLITSTNSNMSISARGASLCLDDILQLNLQNYSDVVTDIIEIAQKELKIENRLYQIETNWNNFTLLFIRHRDTEVYVISPPDEVLDSLEENHLHLQSMVGMGRYVEYFRDRVIKWQTTLGEVENTLKLLLTVSKQWGSLESIFLGSADIRAQLPDDTKRFESVDNEFKEMMRDIQSNPGVIIACTVEGREQVLRNMWKELEKCEKALNEYLEIKKNAFPRFYFVSNAALLDILSNGNNPPKIMPHIGSIFDGISELDLCLSVSQIKMQNDDPLNHDSSSTIPTAAKAMISKDMEKVEFTRIFEMKNAVENWLHDLVSSMHSTLKSVLKNSMTDTTGWIEDGAREEWIFTVPAQIALVTSQIVWTDEVENTLEELEGGQEDAMKKYNELCTQRLESLIRLVQGSLTIQDRIKITTVITIDVHNRDMVTSFVQKKIESNIDFNWQSQLRYYWTGEERNVNIRICDFMTVYSFEYIGNCGRLVITPLTDRCYVTLTSALRLNLGGAPSGPAGTGKTETVKDLARNLGLPCYVFNCSDQMNYQTMADVFKGLAQVGAWGCFDEFNRIDIEVLSVVATQVRYIFNAINYFSIPTNRALQYQSLPAGTPPTKVGLFNFFDEQISLIPTVGLFITMNPGYAGRTELPENLKTLFRSCAMVQPDLQPICENMLMVEGFVKARSLSIKFVTLYKLSSELLSKQNHYDWGLRAIKSVLRVAGVLKRADPDYSEETILMRALRDFNTPKIPNNDMPIFLRLVSDLFPGLDLQPKVNMKLRDICIDVCKVNGLQADETFLSKILQYQELLEIRHSVMLLGPAGCGKTSIWKILALVHNYKKSKPITVYDIVNPKVLTTDELYGYMTLAKDWRDGVLSIIMRNMSTNSSPYSSTQTSKWVVLDGDIDAIWIESMNTVMDDNKVLTLVSNERIPLSESMRMIFEVHSLQNATPATISRAGILYINDTDIGYQPFVDSWLGSRGNDTEKSVLTDIFDRYLHKAIDFFTTSKFETIVKLPIINLVQSVCYLLEGLLKSFMGEKSSAVMERMFLYCLMWAFGGSLVSDHKNSIDHKKIFSMFFKGLSSKVIRFPETGYILDYYIDPISGDAISWLQRLQSMSMKSFDLSNLSIGSTIVVPTIETLRLKSVLDILVRSHRPVMLVGSSGTGKTMVVNDYLTSLTSCEDNFKYVNINMNYYTDSYMLQHQLEQNIDKRSGKNYGPPNGKLIYFIDDFNLPEVETYGTQTSLALIRQHIDHKSWFDRSDLSLKKIIVDCQYITCMNHKNGSFQVDSRLQRHFTTFACQFPSDIDLSTIFYSLVNNHFHSYQFDPKIQNMTQNLTDATVHIFKEISSKFLPSAIKFHYLFTLRDISAVIKGLLTCRPSKDYRTSNSIARLWYHEIMRVFSDRFINESEVYRLQDIVINLGKKYIDNDDRTYIEPCIFTHMTISDIFQPGSKSGSISSINSSSNLVGFKSTNNMNNNNIISSNSTSSTTISPDEECYSSVDDISILKRELERRLTQYNETQSIMNLVLFEQAVRYVTRIIRILKTPGGRNALLIGVGGSGKQSLSKLAAFICNYDIIQLSVTNEFTINDFKENLREMYRKAAVKPGNPIVFTLTDSQIIDERFLVYINDFLSTGRIPDLFTKEEYDGIFTSIRNIAKADGIPDTRNAMMNYFIERVRNNLHMILCFSPVGETFRQRSRKFPGIISCTSINWYHEWKKDALVSVALKYFEDIDFPVPINSSGPTLTSVSNSIKPELEISITTSTPRDPIRKKLDVKESLAYHIAEVHFSVSQASIQYLKEEKRYNYTTPKSFLELIRFYKLLLSTRRTEMINNIRRLEIGLETLVRTNGVVSKLQDFLKEKKKEVESKKLAADVLLEEMGKQRSEAETQQMLADIERDKADDLAKEAQVIENQAAGDLAIAKPAMDAAHQAINCLDKASMTELKSFAKPPPGVEKVSSVMLIMIKNEKKDFSWENAKKMMARLDSFKEKLETYPSEDIPEDIILRVKPYLDDPEFTYDRMRSKSSAAANLTNWVVNIIAYHDIYKRVKPLMDSLEIATNAKKVAEEELEIVKSKLQVIEEKLTILQGQFILSSSEKTKVEQEYKELMDKLQLAERLTIGLSSENERWNVTVEDLRKQEQALPGDVMLAASFVSYIGAFNSSFRYKLWKDIWLEDLLSRDIPISGSIIDPLWILTTDAQTAIWRSDMLPSDRMSLENGAIITNCNRWPLLIDPQLQGIRWLKNYETTRTKENGKQLILIQYGEHGWMNKIIQAIQVGDTVILENITETLDASLTPILSKSVYRKGRGSLYLRIGEDDIEYDTNFRLYLQTKLSNPHYQPEISAQCSIINFTVTKKGLEDQLLASIVSEEEPELERSRNMLLQSFTSYKIQLKELEDNLLERLANAPVDILSDIPLIEGLEATKAKVNEINEAVKKATTTEYGINQTREIYRSVATESSILYFLMLQFSSIDHMYQYSLDSFLYFFLKALKLPTEAIITNGPQLTSPTQRAIDTYRNNSMNNNNINSNNGGIVTNTSHSFHHIPISGVKLERVRILQNTMRWVIYKWVSRGLFDKDRLLFLSQLTITLLQCNILHQETYGFNQQMLQYLLLGFSTSSSSPSPSNNSNNNIDSKPGMNSNSGVGMMSMMNSDEKSPLHWLSDQLWSNIRSLSYIQNFEKLSSDMEENSSRFYEWYQSYAPETEKLPGDWKDLDKHPFKKLLLVRALRPDRLTSAFTSFIKEAIPNGKAYIENDSEFNSYQILEQVYEDSNSKVPIYFILSPGANPISDVDKLAIKYGKVKGIDYHDISLGQGQDIIASERLEVGCRQGHWIFLHNIHLMPRWLSFLEKKLNEYSTMTSRNSSNPNLPVPTMQSMPSTSSIQSGMTTAASLSSIADIPSGIPPNIPPGLPPNTSSGVIPMESNPNIQRIESDRTTPVPSTHPNFRIFLSSDASENIPLSILNRSIKITSDPPSGLKANLKQSIACFSKDTYEDLEPRTKGILFGLCQFHAILSERKKFGTKGYNMMYPFNTGDLICSFSVLKNYMENAPSKVPWADLRYLFGEIMYGGHIVNGFDRLLSKAYLDFYMREELLDEMILYPFMDYPINSNSYHSIGGLGLVLNNSGNGNNNASNGNNNNNSNSNNNNSNNNSNNNTIMSNTMTSDNNSMDNMIFKAPSINIGYEQLLQHIEETLHIDTPLAYGLHSNAEIGYRTNLSNTLIKSILELSVSSSVFFPMSSESNQDNSSNNNSSNSNKNGYNNSHNSLSPVGPGGLVRNLSLSTVGSNNKDNMTMNTFGQSIRSGLGIGGGSNEKQENNRADTIITEINDSLHDVKYDVETMTSTLEDFGPFQYVILQECERMNHLINDILSSLTELELGYRGELTMSEGMDELANSLYLDRVPKRWEKLAYPSQRPLGSWLIDLNNRITQLNDWSSSPAEIPIVTWISGLFNPQSFLTAIMQITAQNNGLELDRLSLVTEVTKKMFTEEITTPAKDGAYIFGLSLEGASWNITISLIEPSKPKEIYSPLPVIQIKPQIIERPDMSTYSCPVYKTQQRGPTYVFSIQLKTKFETAKWILAGTVGLMDTT